MTHHADEMHGGWSEAVTRVLRDLYAPPADPAYWEALEHRIMARVDEEATPWWATFGRWTRAGVAAAALALVASGLAATVATRAAEVRVAYEGILGDTIPTTSYERASRMAGISEVEASFQYVISH
jgi:hypothetical protein